MVKIKDIRKTGSPLDTPGLGVTRPGDTFEVSQAQADGLAGNASYGIITKARAKKKNKPVKVLESDKS